MRADRSAADLVLVGGGLANSLLAYRLAALRPELEVLVLERGHRLGANHTWSFHDSDLSPSQRAWLSPFVEHAWPAHAVRFPGRRRRLGGGYATFTSERLHAVVSGRHGERVRLGVEAVGLRPEAVELGDGSTVRARAVIDGRGPLASPHLVLRYQKFLGQVLELDCDHGLEVPVLMDAEVPQVDGFRFFYLLPLARRHVLVEDTRYSDSPGLDAAELRGAVGHYAERQGWAGWRVCREERGVLPVVLGGDIEAYWQEGPAAVPRSGLRAGFFHPTTGYSLPEAVRLADELSATGVDAAPELYRRLHGRAVALWRRHRFFRMLNRMLFLAAPPGERYRVLERFYGLPEALIGRFYAGRLTAMDKARIVSGSPPVRLGAAIGAAVRRPPSPAGGLAGAGPDAGGTSG